MMTISGLVRAIERLLGGAKFQIRHANAQISRKTWAGLSSGLIWQISNYVIPLLTFPYLARVLGASGFGLIGIGAAVSAYGLLVTDWGFGFTATQAVAQARNSPDEVSKTIWSTILAKVLLGAISAGAIITGSLLLVSDPALRAVLIISTLNIAGSAFCVDWALRGLEQFSKFATASIVGRAAAVPLIYILVQHSSQVAEAAFASSVGGLITAAITIGMVLREHIVRRPVLSFNDAIRQITGSAPVFLSTITISLYTNFLAIALGVTSGAREVGFFTGANKIRTAASGVMSPIGMVAHPRISFLAAADRQRASALCRKVLFVQGSIGFVLAASLCLGAPFAVHILLGRGFEAAVPVLQVLSWLVFVIGLSNVLGVMIMLPFGMKRQVTFCVGTGALVGVCLMVPLSLWWGAFGAALAALCAEIAVTSSMFFFLKKRLPEAMLLIPARLAGRGQNGDAETS